MITRRRVALLLLMALLVAAYLGWREWPRQFLRQGEKALTARDYDGAREQLARYLSYRPNDPRARLLAARAARRLREYYEAFDHLERCRQAGGDAGAIDAETALIAVQRGGEPTAVLLERAGGSDELSLAILEVLIQHDLDHYRLRSALHRLNHYLTLRPDDLQALMARAYVWERFLYFADALGDYRLAVAAHPDDERARLKLGETLLIAATPGEALSHYEWLAARRPEQPLVKLGLARCRRRLGEFDDARRLLDDLLATAPNDGEALWERGQIELDQGRAAEAEAWLRKAVEARPHDSRVAYSLSRCLLALGRRDEAAKLSARVTQLDADVRRLDKVCQAVMERPNDAALRCEGGLLFLRNGERDEGLRWLRQALRIDPNNKEARDALAEGERRGARRP